VELGPLDREADEAEIVLVWEFEVDDTVELTLLSWELGGVFEDITELVVGWSDDTVILVACAMLELEV